MNIKKIFAAVAATAISAASLAAMTFSASATTPITYNGPSEGSLATDNDGISLRRNILNEWTTPVTTDIAKTTTVIDYIKVDFTVSGIGDNYCNHNEDGSEGDPYYAWLAGSIGANGDVWTQDDAAAFKVALTGDGNYSITWDLDQDADTINCLILQTNINFYNYGSSIAESGLDITVTSVTTGTAAEETPSDDATDPSEDATDATDENKDPAVTTTSGDGNKDETVTTTASDDTKKDEKTTTAKADSNKTPATTKAASNGGKNETSANTGDAGVGIAFAALAVAGAAAVIARKKD
ncbi:MAG: NPXTG-anchored protein [Ruminococcus sp.]|nr:NPXTG-anchored protein [Ruminococcus sp.]